MAGTQESCAGAGLVPGMLFSIWRRLGTHIFVRSAVATEHSVSDLGAFHPLACEIPLLHSNHVMCSPFYMLYSIPSESLTQTAWTRPLRSHTHSSRASWRHWGSSTTSWATNSFLRKHFPTSYPVCVHGSNFWTPTPTLTPISKGAPSTFVAYLSGSSTGCRENITQPPMYSITHPDSAIYLSAPGHGSSLLMIQWRIRFSFRCPR
ncbi:hypothetical protein DFH06DRAFT_519473, partial [Mycena polygramma]